MKILEFKNFLFESSGHTKDMTIGSYTRTQNGGISITPVKFNEDIENTLPVIDIEIDVSEDCLFSYGVEDDKKSLSLPGSTIKFPGEKTEGEPISIIMDSNWMNKDGNSDLLYEFIEGYLSEYYNKKTATSIIPEKLAEADINLLMEEFGNFNTPENFKFSEKKITFSDDHERFYKFKRTDRAPISSVEIYEKQGANHPYIKLNIGKLYACEIRNNSDKYKINRDTISSLKEDPIFSKFINLGVTNKDYETKVKDLVKSELELKKDSPDNLTIESNISFLCEELKEFCSEKEIDKLIRSNSL